MSKQQRKWIEDHACKCILSGCHYTDYHVFVGFIAQYNVEVGEFSEVLWNRYVKAYLTSKPPYTFNIQSKIRRVTCTV